MTRIIQRCFVVLAFTGVLLSTAQEKAVSEVSDSSSLSSATPTSAPENSFNTAEAASSFYSSSDKLDKDASFTEEAAAVSSSYSKAAVAAQTSSKVPITSFPMSNADGFTTVSSLSRSSADYTHDVTETKVLFTSSHSDTFKPELNDDISVTEVSGNIENSGNENIGGMKQLNDAPENEAGGKQLTAETAVTQPDYETSSPGYVSIYSGQSSVPSKEELVYNSSYIDKNLSPGDMTSSVPGKVQSGESEIYDIKSLTHKRSLNATKSFGSSTTDMNSNEANSASSNLDSIPSKISEKDEEIYYSTLLTSTQEPISVSKENLAAVENREYVDAIHDVLKDRVAGSTYSINSDNPSVGISAGHIIKSESLVAEPSSSAYLKDASHLPVYLDALSSLKEESIHPSDIFNSAAQIINTRHMSTMSSIPLKSPGLEAEYEEAAIPLVTFDPDGMTHNYTQEPDSITFSPKTVHGKPSSNLEHEDLHNNKPELLPNNLSTAFVTEVVGSSSLNMEEFHSSEREREPPSAGHGLSPHDEPDREEPTLIHAYVSTKSPEEISSTVEPNTLERGKIVLPTNDESEEMLNDSPHFTQSENKSIEIPTAEFTNKYLNKDLENNISNDITHTSDLKSQDLRELHHELDFPIEYQTQPSEIRPVTAVSPIKTSETVTDFPISHDSQPYTTPKETKSDHPDSIPKDTSSPIILPNPAPSIINKSLEKVTDASVSPDILPKDYAPPELLPKDYIPPELLPKDYVPPELLPKDYTTPETLSTDPISSEMIPKDYIPPEMLPKDYVPSEIPPKDHVPLEMLPKDYVPPEMQPKVYVSSEKPPKDLIKPETLPKDYVSPELLPKDYVSSEMPPKDPVQPEMLPKDYVSPELLPKDYVSSEMPPKDPVQPEMLPKDYVSPELLPKDYVPPDLLPKDNVPPEMLPTDNTPEAGNNTDTNINTTIAGVAVKTSVSVSLPISKSPNSTHENSVKELSNVTSKKNDATQIFIPLNKDSDVSSPTTESPTPLTTESKGPRIRKPKIKINSGDDEPATPSTRTRKPFLPSLQKPSSTAGPPVSIFKQARTRMASITSSTTARPFQQFSTIRIHYASRIPGMVPGGEMVFSIEPVSTTIATTTETEEPFSDEPFTGRTVGPVVPTEDNVTLLKVAGVIVVEKGLRWNEQLNNRLSPQYKEREKFVQSQLYRLFRTSVIAPQLWKIQIDGFSGKRNSKSVVIDFFLYLIKSQNQITPEQLVTVFHDKLINNTFSRFTVDTNKTAFEFLNEELMRTTTPPPEEQQLEPVIPQWAIAVIVVGVASLIFIVLFAAVAILGRHHVRRRYSNKLNDEDSDRPSDWESKMAAAYENLAADTIYDAEDFHSDPYKKSYLED